MHIQSVSDPAFTPYGKVVHGYDFAPLLRTLLQTTEKPQDCVQYTPADPALEALPVFAELRDGAYGGMPIQIGYCNGHNRRLNCLEYHRGSEINIAADDVVLLLAPLQAVRDNHIHSDAVEAFLLPAGTAALLYETTLHYAPCSVAAGGFRVAVVLPRGTNTGKPGFAARNSEDALLWARNKWLLVHPDAPAVARGAMVGIVGENLEI